MTWEIHFFFALWKKMFIAKEFFFSNLDSEIFNLYICKRYQNFIRIVQTYYRCFGFRSITMSLNLILHYSEYIFRYKKLIKMLNESWLSDQIKVFFAFGHFFHPPTLIVLRNSRSDFYITLNCFLFLFS